MNLSFADRLDDAKTALMDAFAGPYAFDVDATGEIIASVHAERTIDHVLDAFCDLQRSLSQGGR